MAFGALFESVAQQTRELFNRDHAHLPADELEREWERAWRSCGQITVPQKRSSLVAEFDDESGSKRPPPFHSPAAPPLERHISAPATTASCSIPSSSQTKPISIPGKHKFRNNRRLSTSCTSITSQPIFPTHLTGIRETDLSPAEWLDQVPDSNVDAAALSFSASVGELTLPEVSRLLVPSYQFDGVHSPAYTATSDAGMTTSSTVYSEPMSRRNTDDELCEPFDILKVDGAPTTCTKSALRIPKGNFFPSSCHFPSFPSSVSKAPVFIPQSLPSPTGLACGFRPNVDQLSGKNRLIMPKKLDEVSETQTKIVAFTDPDGRIKHKVEIPRPELKLTQRKAIQCQFCNEQPLGFHGDHELRRHIERHHTQIRKVWVCKDASADGKFLANCKACRNHKSYGANYNAAAHLRRAHFNPCKNKRGGRGKKSENRGGKGGGNTPSMEFLKSWMFETFEMNSQDKVIVQEFAPDSLTQAGNQHVQATVSDNLPIDVDTFDHDFDFELDPSLLAVSHKQPQDYNTYAPLANYNASHMFSSVQQQFPPSIGQPYPSAQMQQHIDLNYYPEATFNGQ